MRWLCLLVLSGCYDEQAARPWLAVDKNGFVVDRVELFGAPSVQRGAGLPTPELVLTGRTPPSDAELWSPHQSYGYAVDDADIVTYDNAYPSGLLIAIGWRGDQAALAGYARAPTPGYPYDVTITLAPDDVEIWSSHACVRYTNGDEYIYLLPNAGCW